MVHQKPTIGPPKRELKLLLPFLGYDSLILRNNIKKLFNNALPQFDLKIIFTNTRRIGDLFKVKDTIPTNWKSHVVYHIKCDACNASYIGKTVNTIHERFHVGTESAHLSSKNENSPLITHLHQYPTHSFDTDTVKILCSAPYNTALEIMESLNIQYYKSSLNRNIYSRPLYLF